MTWCCHPLQERPSKWSRPADSSQPIFVDREPEANTIPYECKISQGRAVRRAALPRLLNRVRAAVRLRH